MYSPFRTTTASQSEIFSVIVDWSIFSYVFTFQDHNILSKWNIFCYCRLVYFWYVFTFQDHNILSKWNIFCYCRLVYFWYVFTFQDHYTLQTGLGEGGVRLLSPTSLICNKTWFETKMLTSNEIKSILGFVPRTTILGFVDGKTFCLRSGYTSEWRCIKHLTH